MPLMFLSNLVAVGNLMSVEKNPYFRHLSDIEKKVLFETYAKHNSSVGLEERKNYTLSDIVKVERSIKENCLNVYYKNGDWWHYTANMTWY